MKKLKIIMGNATLALLAGSETYLETLAKEFKRLGHEVTAYSPQLGLIATKLEAVGIRCVDSIKGQGDGKVRPFTPYFEADEGQYDIIICSHYEITKYLHDRLPDTPIIGIVHGILHKNVDTGEIWPEHPVTEFKVDQYIAVSEEVQGILKRFHNIEAKVIRNFIDLKRFKKEGKLSKKPRSVLVNSNYWTPDDPINQIIKKVADNYDISFMGIGANFASTYETEEILKDADIVFGMGRSILEAAAMGKVVVCHGRWGTGGVLDPKLMVELAKTNFSGRLENSDSRPLLEAPIIISQIDEAYNQKNVDAVHGIMKKHHNVEVVAKEFLKIAEGLINK